jgi:DNA-binding MarR family transcriptional regulator
MVHANPTAHRGPGGVLAALEKLQARLKQPHMELHAVILLLRVADAGVVSMTQLVQDSAASASAVSRAVQSLVEAGLAERYEDPGNRRYKMVRATAAGRSLMKEVAA